MEGNTAKIRIVLAEDHHVVRTAVAALLSKEPDLEVVGEVADGNTLVQTVARIQPDILVMDAQMPNHKPVEATRALHATCPDLRIVVLSAYDLPEYVVGLLKAGADGYVLKDDPSDMLVRAIRAVAEDEEWVSPRVAAVLVDSVRSNDSDAGVKLTGRELDVLRLMAHGHKNSDIAQELVITKQTVKNHVTNIFRKLGVETRVEAVLYAISHGLVSTSSIRDELNSN